MTGLNRRALFTDETQDYRRPEEPDAGDRVALRFRTAKNNADSVYYIEEEKKLKARMIKVSSDECFDFYEYVIVVDRKPRRYYFEVIKDGESCCFNRLGAVEKHEDCFAFRITPGFHTPE